MEEKEVILENLVYAEFVLERWLIREKYPELKKVVGNIFKFMDPIADMISSINNAIAVSKKQMVIYPYSDFKFNILEVLRKEGVIGDIEKKGKLSTKRITVNLKYDEKGKPAITKIKLVSKQGQRIYKQVKEIKKVKSGHGFAIISSSKGLITNKDAKKMKTGGEMICEVW